MKSKIELSLNQTDGTENETPLNVTNTGIEILDISDEEVRRIVDIVLEQGKIGDDEVTQIMITTSKGTKTLLDLKNKEYRKGLLIVQNPCDLEDVVICAFYYDRHGKTKTEIAALLGFDDLRPIKTILEHRVDALGLFKLGEMAVVFDAKYAYYSAKIIADMAAIIKLQYKEPGKSYFNK